MEGAGNSGIREAIVNKASGEIYWLLKLKEKRKRIWRK